MKIIKQGTDKVFLGKAKCETCGTEFTYDDSDVTSEKTGSVMTGVYRSGMMLGSSTITHQYYVVCPHCSCYVKTNSIKGRNTNIALLTIFGILFFVFIITISALLTSPSGPKCNVCGHETKQISKYNQYQCPYYDCKDEGTHYTYHCENCWEYYHIVK